MINPRFFVGIDLGTTHCVLSYLELRKDDSSEEADSVVLSIPQLLAPGEVGTKPQLPSFLYEAHNAELGPHERRLPWEAEPKAIVGELARQLGAKTPIRLVASAKSWLSHSGVDRRSALLPVQATEDVPKVSPLTATIEYLRHLRDAWNHEIKDAVLSNQDLVITVPASFDPVARELTLEAAHSLGLHQAVLLEEPQAAFYSWIQSSHGQWRAQVKPGEVILVVDVGGGTTDLSLIAVSEDQGSLSLKRVAIGDHILLGGDNMDLALAYTLKNKLEGEGKRIEAWQIQALTHACRQAKESLLVEDGPDVVEIAVPNRGSSLIGGVIRTRLTRDEVDDILVNGFFPEVDLSDLPKSLPRTGLTTVGLPYAQDPRVTSHLAAFLTKQVRATEELDGFNSNPPLGFLKPNAILLNGGVFKSSALVRRIVAVVNRWSHQAEGQSVRLLSGADLDHSVARGAAYYGSVRKGHGVRIRGGIAAAYYVGVESAMPAVPGLQPPLEALCIAPFGMEEGTQAELPPFEFGVVVGEPVHFRFFVSKTRREDSVGTRLDSWTHDELEELEPIEVVLSADNHHQGQVIPVHLGAKVTEVGTLQLEAISKLDQHRWKVELNVRPQQ